jgi:GNAT superfamily N-acetyltransferase
MSRTGAVWRDNVTWEPLTLERWRDLVTLFGDRGACGGCWCMAWRCPPSAWERQKGAGNRRALRRLVEQGPPPGIIGYRDGRPIGWCAIAPRDRYPTLARSRVLARVDEAPVWSISCLFVAKSERNRGVSAHLLRAAVAFAETQGARLVEGDPVDAGGRQPDPFVWTGLVSSYLAAGFREVARRSATRPIMRRAAGEGAQPDAGDRAVVSTATARGGRHPPMARSMSPLRARRSTRT